MAEKGFKRKLTAILSADAVEYSRLMGQDEETTVRTITAYREVLSTLIQQHNGKVLDSPGDNLLAEFVSVVDAVQCAVAVQKEIKARNDQLPENRRMQFRIGINLGDVIQEEERIYGDGVNIAARLEGLANPGGICISKTAFDHIESKLPYGYEFLGDQTVKNIAKPVGAYRVVMEPRVTVAGEKEAAEVIPFWRRKAAIAGAIVVLVVIIGVGVWKFYLRPPPIEPASVEKMAYPLPDKPSIAVLPFENLSGDPKQDYLSDGITEVITSTISKVPKMFVIASRSSFSYKGKAVKIQQVAEELGVQYVLEGNVLRSGEKLRVAVQLVDALKGNYLWSERYDVKMDDLLDVQDEIAMNVLAETQVKLTEGEQALARKRETHNLKALEKQWEAWVYFKAQNRDDNFKALQLYKEAIKLDPKSPRGYREAGWCHLLAVWFGWSQDPRKSMQMANDLAQKALALDENNSETLTLWANIHMFKAEFDKAIKICRRAAEINPNMADVNAVLGMTLRIGGLYEEAIAMFEKATRLNPFPPSFYYQALAKAYYFAGRYEEAVVACKKSLQKEQRNVAVRVDLTAAYVRLGQEEEARATAAEILSLDPKFSVERLAKHFPHKDREGKERYMEALRKAGLPD